MVDKKQARLEIGKLIEKCRQIKSNRSAFISYDEANTRKDLIMPLFECLGWDVFNDFNHREVIEEDSAIEGRVDYSFNINGIPKFLLEAKALKVNLDKVEWAKQAVTYGWNKGIPWVILTDFEGLKIFNSDWRIDEPRPNLEFYFEEYVTRFDDLWLLSRELIEKGELDKFAAKWGITAKRIKVSEKLAKDLVKWRELLTRNFKQWNDHLSDIVIDEAVQRTLDRLIFIRVAEDRGLEQKVLWQILHKWLAHERRPYNFMQELKPLFREFDKKYNSSLFQPHVCEELETEGLPFERIINDLYSNKEGGVKYRFDAIDSDVLGSIYEQYLGHVQQKRLKTKEGEKRKKQGIYYTPSYIVNYIVENTLGIAVKEKSLKEIDKVKVLDPACGSGSFLIKAFDVLDAYIKDKRNDDRSIDPLRRFDILTKNIYGVDLDVQAVEIARLNLLLKALTPGLRLPNLADNVKEGNSLISEGRKELKPFNWKKEYKEVFSQGGFDVIIGNPPYIKEDANRMAFDGLRDSPYYQGKMDLWTSFACIAIDLLKEGGYLSFIAPSSWIANTGASIFRKKILTSGEIIKFVDFSDFKVFKDASIQTMIFIFQKKKPKKSYKTQYIKITSGDISSNSVAGLLSRELNVQTRSKFLSIFNATLNPREIGNKSINFSDDIATEILKKIENESNFKLSKENIGNGIDVLQDFVTEKHLLKLKDKTIQKGDGVFVLRNSFINELKLNEKEQNCLKPYYTTKQINRFLSSHDNQYKIIYADKYFRENISQFPNLKGHIDRFKEILTSAFAPYGLHRSRKESFFKEEAIFLLRKTMYPAFTYVNFPCYVARAFLILKPKNINLRYLTALLNSKLTYFWLKNKGKKQGQQLQIDIGPLLEIPLINPNKKIQENISSLVEQMIKLNGELHKIPEKTDKWYFLKIKVGELEQKIDHKIYNLYRLNEKEIEIIENAFSENNSR